MLVWTFSCYHRQRCNFASGRDSPLTNACLWRTKTTYCRLWLSSYDVPVCTIQIEVNKQNHLRLPHEFQRSLHFLIVKVFALVAGRLSKAECLLVARYPIILDSKHPAVKRFLQIHKSNSHELQSPSLVALFKSNFAFCVVGLPSGP